MEENELEMGEMRGVQPVTCPHSREGELSLLHIDTSKWLCLVRKGDTMRWTSLLCGTFLLFEYGYCVVLV